MKSKVCSYCEKLLTESSFGVRKTKYGLKHREVCKSCHTIKNSLSRKKCGRKTSPKTQKRARERATEYYYANKHTNDFKSKACSMAAKRRALSLSATPNWLSEAQIQEIKKFYWLAKDLQAVTGEQYHVDHIVPLKGENVCGLHVPWNLQVLPADINLSKGNSYDDYA